MTNTELLNRADVLRHGRTPFVLATVVHVERPTSARPGDSALVLPDGTVEDSWAAPAPRPRCNCRACGCWRPESRCC